MPSRVEEDDAPDDPKKTPSSVPRVPSPDPLPPKKKAQPVSLPLSGSMNINRIGILIDRWSDTIEGKGNIAESVLENTISELLAKKMPNITLKRVQADVGILSQSKRPYIIAETHPGVRTAIYVAAYGKDLYVSWRTHVRGTLNRRLFLFLAAFAAFPSLCTLPCSLLISVLNILQSRVDLGALCLPSIGLFVGIFFFELMVVAAWGYFTRGFFLAYFYVEPNLFDAENVLALSLSVHKALKNAVAATGTNVGSWEQKITFNSGRASERI